MLQSFWTSLQYLSNDNYVVSKSKHSKSANFAKSIALSPCSDWMYIVSNAIFDKAAAASPSDEWQKIIKNLYLPVVSEVKNWTYVHVEIWMNIRINRPLPMPNVFGRRPLTYWDRTNDRVTDRQNEQTFALLRQHRWTNQTIYLININLWFLVLLLHFVSTLHCWHLHNAMLYSVLYNK